jgi:hypothetical protein
MLIEELREGYVLKFKEVSESFMFSNELSSPKNIYNVF